MVGVRAIYRNDFAISSAFGKPAGKVANCIVMGCVSCQAPEYMPLGVLG